MSSIQITWTNDFHNLYRQSGHPLGKSRRGRKKWVKRYVVLALTALANETT